MNGQPPKLVTVDGHLCLWRVFELGRDYQERPKDDTSNIELHSPRAASSPDSVNIIIGTFPHRIQESIRQLRARAPYMLNDVFANAYHGMSINEREAVISTLYAETSLDDLNIGDTLYLTIEIRRPTSIEVNDQFHFLWGAGAAAVEADALNELTEEGAPLLDIIAAWILPTLSRRGLSITRKVWGDDRAILVLPERAAIWMPRLSGSANAIAITAGNWRDQNWTDLESALATFIARPTHIDALIQKPSRWLNLAMGETDAVRRFLFAYCGLEVLANKFVAKFRDRIKQTIGDSLPGVPVGELLWPSLPDENAPQRNLVFAFAAMATLVKRDGADTDTDLFRRISRARNMLAHGDADDLSNLPVGEAVALLTRSLESAVVFAARLLP